MVYMLVLFIMTSRMERCSLLFRIRNSIITSTGAGPLGGVRAALESHPSHCLPLDSESACASLHITSADEQLRLFLQIMSRAVSNRTKLSPTVTYRSAIDPLCMAAKAAETVVYMCNFFVYAVRPGSYMQPLNHHFQTYRLVKKRQHLFHGQ